MARYLIDTDIVIDQLRGKRSLLSLFEEYFPDDKNPELHFSFITLFELLIGDAAQDVMHHLMIKEIIYDETVESIDHNIERAAEIVRQKNIRGLERNYRFIPDSIIAATAINRGLILVSRNKRDFAWLGKKLQAKFIQ